MKTFRQYITERPTKISIILKKGMFRSSMEEIRGLVNPTFSELTSFIKNTPLGVRFLVHPSKKLYVWDGAKHIHIDVERGEGIEDSGYLKGSITYDKYSDVYAVLTIEGGKNGIKKAGKNHSVFKEILDDTDIKVSVYK